MDPHGEERTAQDEGIEPLVTQLVTGEVGSALV